LPAHPLLMDVHGWSLYVTVYIMTRTFWPSNLTFTARKCQSRSKHTSISLINLCQCYAKEAT
jgi:hypothetical protein